MTVEGTTLEEGSSRSRDRRVRTGLASGRAAGRVVYVVLLTGLAAAVYGPHVLEGGFAWDDWENAATTSLSYRDQFLGPFDVRQAIYEPGLTAALPIPHLLFGLRPAWHLGLAVLLGVAMSLCTFALLRELGVAAVPAALAGALSLVFPWSDSVRLWATAGLNQVAVCLYLAGATLGLRGLKAAAQRRSTAAFAGRCLMAASVLTYPVTILAVIATPALYRLRVSWSRAWRAGLPAALIGLVALAWVSLTTTKPTQPLDGQLAHLATIVADWASLLALSIAMPERLPTLAFAVSIAGATWLAVHTARRRATRDDLAGAAALSYALAMLWGGALAALLAYLLFSAGDEKYAPLAAGLYNRAGILAGPAVAAMAVGAIMLLTELTVAPVARVAVAPASVLVAALLVADWAWAVRSDAADWDRAAQRARRVLAVIDAQLPVLAQGSTIYTVGHRRYQAAGIPVFSSSFDLDAAIKLRRRDASIAAFALPAPLRCAKHSAAPGRAPYDRLQRASYRRLYVLNVARQRVWAINTRRDCEQMRVLLRRSSA